MFCSEKRTDREIEKGDREAGDGRDTPLPSPAALRERKRERERVRERERKRRRERKTISETVQILLN